MHSRTWISWLVGVISVALAAAVIAPNFMGRFWSEGPEPSAKQNLHILQLALERYAVDHDGLYPATLQPLHDEAYLVTLPENPYDRKNRAPMPEVPIGQHTPGGVTYIPLHASSPADLEPGQPPGAILTYMLVGYGARHDYHAATARQASTRLPGGAAQRIPWEYVLMTLDGGYPGKPSG